MTKIHSLVLLVFCFLVGVYTVYTYLPVRWVVYDDYMIGIGVDWQRAFLPALIALLHGESPYTVPAFFNPPWLLLPLLPLALLSPALGSAVMFVLNLMAYVYTALKLRMNIVLIGVFIIFSGMLENSINGNIEGLLVLGFLLPPQIGLFFILVKPQLGIAVAAFWAVESFREGGTVKVIKVFAPVVSAFVISFLVYGFYAGNSEIVLKAWWNSSIFPYGVPVGLVLLGLALWKREIRFAIAASPFFAPYVTGHGWAVVWLGMLSLLPALPALVIRRPVRIP